jgi:hypothetical protein
MIRGIRKIELTPSEIFRRISPYDIYRHYFGKFEPNQVTCNWIRGDKNPSFIISNRGGELYHYDFADSTWRGDCISFVEQIHGCDYNRALRIIDAQFGLGIVSGVDTGEYKRIKSQYKQPEETIGKRYSVIQVVTRKFTNSELEYWRGYYQDIEDLRENNIHSISKAYLNRKLFPIKEDELRFGYLFGGSYWKLYFIEREKKRKWISNVPLNLAYGLSNLSPDKNTLICKSLKDYMLCRKVYNNVCGIQNESLAALSEETVKYINENSKEVFYGGDSDIPGKQASYIITRAFGWKHINPPDYLLEDCCKDWSDWGKKYNLESVKNHFISKGLID